MPRPSPPAGDDADAAIDAALRRVDEALASDRPADALALADEALSLHADEADLHHARGAALRLLDEPEQALEAFELAVRLDPQLTDAWLDAAEVVLEDFGTPVEAISLLAEARRRVDDPRGQAEIEFLRGLALSQMEDFTGALQALDEAARLGPTLPDVHAERAGVIVELLDMEGAEEALARALELQPGDARAHELLAFVLDYTGRREAAQRHFLLAASLDDELPATGPPRVNETEFDALVAEALAGVPEPFAARLKNVEISVENYADKDFCRRHDCSPTVLGMYVGTPLPERGADAQGLPDRIILFQRALENAARDRAHLVEEIGVTVRHEIGHLLGFSDDELHERGHG